MSRIGVTYLDVANAIPKLQTQGKAITGDNVRAELGTGSKSTITRLLREWKQQQGLPMDDDGSLPSELLSTVKGLWQLLQAKADDTIDSHQQECDSALSAIQQQLIQYKAKDTDWQGRVHVLEEKLHQQNEENKRLNASLIAEQQEKIKARGRIETLQVRYQDSQSENERLHQLLKHVQANLEHYQAEAQKLRLEQEIIVERQRVDYEHRLLQFQQQIEVMIREKTFLEARCAGLDKNYSASLVRETAVTEGAEQLRQKYVILEANHDTLKQNLREVSEELIAQRQALETKNRELIEGQLKLSMAEDKASSFQKALAAAEDKVVVLRADYLFLSQEKSNLEKQLIQLQEILNAYLEKQEFINVT